MTSITRPTLAERRAVGNGRRLFWTLAFALGAVFIFSSTTGCMRSSRHFRAKAQTKQIERHMNRGIRHEFCRAGATREQRKQAKAIVADLAPDLALLHSEGGVLVDRLLLASRSPEIDNAEFDAIRDESAELMERTTGEVVTAAEELASILTPEQRAKLAKRSSHRRGFWHRR